MLTPATVVIACSEIRLFGRKPNRLGVLMYQHGAEGGNNYIPRVRDLMLHVQLEVGDVLEGSKVELEVRIVAIHLRA